MSGNSLTCDDAVFGLAVVGAAWRPAAKPAACRAPAFRPRGTAWPP